MVKCIKGGRKMKGISGVVFSPHPPIIIPEIGQGSERALSQTKAGMHQVASFIKDQAPEVIICITPHGNVFQDAICLLDEPYLQGDFTAFNCAVRMKKAVDLKLNRAIQHVFLQKGIAHLFMKQLEAKQYRAKIELDHGCMVPLYYIDQAYTAYRLVHLTIGLMPLLELYQIGMALQQAVLNSGYTAVVLASGDLSHCLKNEGAYRYHPQGPVFDDKIKTALMDHDFFSILTLSPKIYNPAGQCGLRPFVLALGAVDGKKSDTQVYSYEGPFGVGYLTASLKVLSGETDSLVPRYHNFEQQQYVMRCQSEDVYMRLARTAIEAKINKKAKLKLKDFCKQETDTLFKSRILKERRGAFVSLSIDGILRGCIGTIEPIKRNLGEEIIYNAVQAAQHDPRFTPVTKKELLLLEIKVDILHPIELIQNELQLDVKKYGVIVEAGKRRGLLLPNLEGINEVTEQVRIARRKAGIHDGEKVKLYRFEVERHEVL